MTPDTFRLAEGYVQVKPLGPVAVKGLNEPVEVYEVTGAGAVRSRLQAAAARGLTRFVGRNAETDSFTRHWNKAKRARARWSRLSENQVLASPAVLGVHPFASYRDGLIVESGSVSYGKATAYLPIIDLLKGYFEIEDRDDVRKIREKVTGKLLTLDKF